MARFELRLQSLDSHDVGVGVTTPECEVLIPAARLHIGSAHFRVIITMNAV